MFVVFGEERDRILRSAERTSGSISICGSLFIIVTFLSFPAFNKAFNRLAFYAAFGNIFASSVALISLDGPKAGPNSGLCQFQGFLVQLLVKPFPDFQSLSICLFWNDSNHAATLLPYLPTHFAP
jgi:hypothetical protein